MIRTSITQKQYKVSQRNGLVTTFSREPASLEPSSIIKSMIKIIKTESKEDMDVKTHVQFSKIADAIVRMVEETSE